MKRKNIKAQAAIEFSLALIVLFMFLLGAFRLFLWLNKNLVYRQENYASTRRLAGNPLVMRHSSDSETDYDARLNNMKNIVVNEFYVDKDRLSVSEAALHDIRVALTEDELNRHTLEKGVHGVDYPMHEYEKFEMFPGAE